MKKTAFNDNWMFTKESGAQCMLCLPHDAMLEEKRSEENPLGNGCACFAGGRYVYEKTFFASQEWEEQDVMFEFEGVYPQAEVFLNGEKMGDCFYGYSDYLFAAKHLYYNEENVLKVVVDNTKTPNSRWYSGAGIYRPVWLLTGAKSHILPGGLRVKTLGIEPAEIEVCTKYVCAGGEVSVKEGGELCADVENKLGTERVQIDILDGGRIVASAEGEHVRILIPDAELWSAENPKLYQCRAVLTENGNIVDEETISFGVRQITWSTDGLFINNKKTLLKGGCIHHDNGILGARTYKESEWRRIRRLKEFGFNAIRSAHNPAGKDVLEACDALGMYVMDEGWDMWFEAKTAGDYASRFMQHYEEDICSMTAKDYNHPSVIMYSIGNEVTEPEKEEGVELAQKLIDSFHRADDTRPVTAGINITLMFLARMGMNMSSETEKQGDETGQEEKINSTYFNEMVAQRAESMKAAANRDEIEGVAAPVLDKLDIAGYNYAAGRYPMEKEKHPNRIVVGSETYPYELAQTWKMVEMYPYVIGDFMWTAWDYLGEAGLGAWTYEKKDIVFSKIYPWLLADTGAFDILGNDTAEAGMAAVVWGARETPYIGVQPINHNPRDLVKAMWRGSNALPYWSYEGCKGNPAVVEVYSMADAVELLVNGVSVGRKKIIDAKAVFETVYEPGTVEAVAYDKTGNEISRSSLISAAGKRNLSIQPETEPVKEGQILYVDISVRGENGEVECNHDVTLKVSVEGGELLAFGSANPKTEEDFLAGEYTTYYGRSQAVILVGNVRELVIAAEETGKKGGFADKKRIVVNA